MIARQKGDYTEGNAVEGMDASRGSSSPVTASTTLTAPGEK